MSDFDDIMSKAAPVLLVICVLAFFLISSIYYVGGGKRGVLFRSAIGETGYDMNELSEGFGMKVPFLHKVKTMDVRTQTLGLYGDSKLDRRGEFGVLTPKDKNGVNFEQDITVRYRLDANQAAEFVKTKGTDTEDVLITALRGTAREIFGTYAQEEVPDKKGEISLAIKDALQTRLDSEVSYPLQAGFIKVEAVDLRNTNFNEKIENAIINKQEALQLAQKAEYTKQEEMKNKEIAIVKAEAQQESAIIRAEGESQAILKVAKAKAEGLRQINLASQGLSNEYVQMKYAEALSANAESGNTMIVDFTRFGGNNIGLLDWNKMTPIVKTTSEE